MHRIEEASPLFARPRCRERSNPNITTMSKQFSLTSPFLAGCVLAACALSACKSDPPRVTLKDSQGNFVTTADFEAMDREEFIEAIEAGLSDFDTQLNELRTRANELGGDSLKEFAECESELQKERTALVNQLAIARNALNDKWPAERAETVDVYTSLREDLAEAQKDVLDR